MCFFMSSRLRSNAANSTHETMLREWCLLSGSNFPLIRITPTDEPPGQPDVVSPCRDSLQVYSRFVKLAVKTRHHTT